MSMIRSSLAWSGMLVLLIGTCVGFSADLPVFSLAAIPDADLDTAGNWSAPQKDGDIAYRSAIPGPNPSKDGVIHARVRVKAWWDDQALRPWEGTIYILEVKYKDTVKTPAVFTVEGAIASYFVQNEAHRFGGMGDGQWKTACVPVAWDGIARIINTVKSSENHPDQTGFGVNSTTELPISSVTVRLSTPADEARFNAETRAWVATVQAGRRSPIKVEDRKFLVGKELSPIVAFPCPPLVRLSPGAQPKDDQVGAPIKIRMCLNQFQSGAFGIYANGADLSKVTYTLSDLKNQAGVSLKADVTCRTYEYALASASQGKAPSLVAQRLWPVFPVDIPKGQSYGFCFDIRTSRGQAVAGLYKGSVCITSATGKAELPVEVDVLPVDLLTMDEAGLCLGGCTAGLVPQHDIDFQVAYNQNAVNLWFSGCKPNMAIKDGKLVLDFTYMDDWLIRARQHGMTNVVYFLGGDPYGFPYTVTAVREIYRLLHPGASSMVDFAKAQSAAPEKMLPEVRPCLQDFIRQLYAHARLVGWPEVLVTPFDEPAKWVQKHQHEHKDGELGSGPWIKTYYKDYCTAIHAADPKARIYASIHHLNRNGQQDGLTFLDDVDVFCTNAIHEDPTVGDKVRAVPGKVFWQYGGGPSPESAAFQYGFFFGAFNSRGGLCWAYNWGAGFDISEGENWMYAWQTPYATIPSPYFIGIRQGLDDRRLIDSVRRKCASNPAAMKVLNDVLKEAEGSRAEGGRDTVNDFWAAVDDVHKLDVWRNKLLDLLVK